MLVFPGGARRVRCGKCHTITSGLRVRCTSCSAPNTIKLGEESVKCAQCGYQFTPQSTLKVVVEERLGELPRLLSCKVSVDRTISASIRSATLQVVATQPLRESAVQWATKLGADFSRAAFYCNDRLLAGSSTPRELELADGCEIIVRQSNAKNAQGHDFASSQFSAPTNCAHCKSFIWGIYHQGKRCTKCKVPVHHRCAVAMKATCEADLRQLFGVVNVNDEDDEGEEAPVLGVVVEEQDKIAFASRLEEVAAPECDPNFMKGFNKLSNFTDEEIQQMWLQYDQDESGSLDSDEIRVMLRDLMNAGGAHVDDLSDMRQPVERLIARMDTNGDGSIQWEEFWHFFKAQQTANFLTQFAPSTGTDASGSRQAALSLDDIYRVWMNYDEDSSGVLEIDEVLHLLNDVMEMIASASGHLGSEKARLLTMSCRGKFESFLSGAERMTWEAFYTTFVPVLQKVASAQSSSVL